MASSNKTVWRFIDTGFNNGYFNMAVDETLTSMFFEQDRPILRIYAFEPPCLSIGYFQRGDRIRFDRCDLWGIDLVRRPTGGRAVLHNNQEVAYSVIGPSNSEFGTSIPETYRKISKAISFGLQLLGVSRAQPLAGNFNKSESGYIRSEFCFASRTRFELAVGDKKIVGSAQRRYADRFLQQGSIPLRPQSVSIAALFYASEKESKATSISQSGLENIVGRTLGYEEVRESLKQGFARAFNCELEKKPLGAEEIIQSRRLEDQKYRGILNPRNSPENKMSSERKNF